MELKMKKEKDDLERLNEQLDNLHYEKIKLTKLIEGINVKLDLYRKKLSEINYDIELKHQYIDIIKKREGVYYE